MVAMISVASPWAPCLFAAESAPTTAPPPVIYRARVKGVINPFSARYLERAIRETEHAGAAALVLELDTPGASTRRCAR